MSGSPPWYAKGLRFECQRCSRCCRGEPGYVWVDDPQIAAMATALGMNPDEFVRAYVRVVGARRTLKELPGGDCILWGGLDVGCLVYAVRPTQCRTFPFWRQHLRSPEKWELVAAVCPGINRGRLFSRREIDRLLKHRV